MSERTTTKIRLTVPAGSGDKAMQKLMKAAAKLPLEPGQRVEVSIEGSVGEDGEALTDRLIKLAESATT